MGLDLLWLVVIVCAVLYRDRSGSALINILYRSMKEAMDMVGHHGRHHQQYIMHTKNCWSRMTGKPLRAHLLP